MAGNQPQSPRVTTPGGQTKSLASTVNAAPTGSPSRSGPSPSTPRVSTERAAANPNPLPGDSSAARTTVAAPGKSADSGPLGGISRPGPTTPPAHPGAADNAAPPPRGSGQRNSPPPADHTLNWRKPAPMPPVGKASNPAAARAANARAQAEQAAQLNKCPEDGNTLEPNKHRDGTVTCVHCSRTYSAANGQEIGDLGPGSPNHPQAKEPPVGTPGSEAVPNKPGELQKRMHSAQARAGATL